MLRLTTSAPRAPAIDSARRAVSFMAYGPWRPDPMKCPICKKEVKLNDPEAPFCSERCRIIDLGNWASEKYVISTPLRPGEMPDLEDDDDTR
jgi:endogenous inhibitor of DNA gyrase (YacG/DUF329 family)